MQPNQPKQKPRNLQFHTNPATSGPPPKFKPVNQKTGSQILGQADTTITNLKGKGAGKTLVVCGNGPSIAGAPLENLKGVPGVEFMSINIPDPRVWPTEYWLLLDAITMRRKECAGFIPDYQGIVITNHVKKPVAFRHLVRVLLHRSGGISRDLLKGIRMGGSSGYVALQVALYLGHKDIYFFGMDMAKSETGELWVYGENSAIDAEMREKKFETDAHHWDLGTKELTPEERARIHICSEINPWPFVKEYDQLSPEAGVEKILGPITTKSDEPAKPADSPDAADSSL